MEERFRSLEEQLERVTAQLTERDAALGTFEERLERLTAVAARAIAAACAGEFSAASFPEHRA